MSVATQKKTKSRPRPKARLVASVLLARPLEPPAWWPKTLSGWVTVGRDLDGWTAGIHSDEAFLATSKREITARQRAFDEELDRVHEYRLAAPWAIRQWATTGVVGEAQRVLCPICDDVGTQNRRGCAQCDGDGYLGFVDSARRAG
jgi:hypothetical protein